jgi:hypothetical protein
MRVTTQLCGLAAIAVLTGCRGDLVGPTAASIPSIREVGPRAAVKRVPFKGSFNGTSTVAPGRCAALTNAISGTGQITHLGHFTTAQSHCIDPTGADPLAFTDGVFTFTAANGDTIFGTYSGRLVPTATPGLFQVDGVFTIEGGTGRFANASGGGDASGETDLADPAGPATVILAGSISTVGSTRTSR